MKEDIMAVLERGGMRVEVVKEEGMVGYRFDAVDEESLPLAAELAVLQTQRGIPYIDGIIREAQER